MKVAFTIDPNGTSSSPLDWSVNLTLVGGGFIESSEEFMN